MISMPNEPKKIYGSECLDWINKKIGFGSHAGAFGMARHSDGLSVSLINGCMFGVYGVPNTIQIRTKGCRFNTTLLGWNHNPDKRKVGLILDRYSDGGYKVAILSTDDINNGPSTSNVELINHSLQFSGYCQYVNYADDPSVDLGYKRDPGNPIPSMCTVKTENVETYEPSQCNVIMSYDSSFQNGTFIGFDELVDYDPNAHIMSDYSGLLGRNFTINNGDDVLYGKHQLTTNKNTTVVFGDGFEVTLPQVIVPSYAYFNDPLYLLSGYLYDFANLECIISYASMCPARFLTHQELYDYENAEGNVIFDTNFTSVPYNLILTENETQALAYLSDGTLPDDCFLFPLDWKNFPKYNSPDDDGTDGDDDNNPDDNNRDMENNVPIKPHFTPSMLSNYNWYWLDVSQFEGFINWFWNDVGNVSDFSSLIEKIEGLYNNLASAVLMVRYMPVNVEWIGGLGNQSHIVLGMIEKNGNYDTISNSTSPNLIDIGTISIPSKYNSFVDLSPYSMLSLYLPFHGFVDLDINILSGHDLSIKAMYDHLSGTIQYYLFCDNTFLINSFVCKMAVDIPITLQTKNDRDSAIFSNVSSAVGGLIGAGTTLATGNPIGLMVGANAFNSGTSTAPLNVKGTVGETGAFYSPEHCYIILRRPTLSKPETWKTNVGQMCGKSYTLNSLRSKGLTTVFQPRIKFNKTAPLQSEVDEIYEYLEKGVIL